MKSRGGVVLHGEALSSAMAAVRHTTQPLARTVRAVCLGAALALTACDSTEDRPYRAASTARMADRLDSIARATDSDPTQYANRALLAAIRDRRAAPDRRSQLLHRASVGEQLLRSGDNRDAVAAFEEIQWLIAESTEMVPPEFVAAIADHLAISYLRVAQQEHCFEGRGSARCSSPIPAAFGDRDNAAARAAAAAYDAILQRQPGNLESRWLINVAYMMLGEYPGRVPPRWLIPEAALPDDYDITWFRDVAPALGLDVVGRAGGSIADDFDGDGYVDVMASSWGLRDQIRYFSNTGEGSFEDRTVEAGLDGIVSGLNTVHADYNNNGFPDVLILRGAWHRHGHPNSLLRNNGDGTFDDVTEESGLFEASPTQAAVWGDFDNDGWVDLFIGNESIEPVRNPSRLFHNNGDGTFTDIAPEAGVAVIGFVKGVTAADYDNDGKLDLYVSRLRESNLLFRNEGWEGGPPTFVEVGEEAGVREPTYSFPTWFFDYDNDGWEDLFVSGFFATSGDMAAEYLGQDHRAASSRLYRNTGKGTFIDATAAARLGHKVLLTMGSNFGDLDNDGFLDLFLGTGDPDFQTFMPNRVFRNAAGEFFEEVTASGGFGHLQKGHGVSFADFDNDGDQDIHTVIGGAYEGDVARNALYVNPGHGNRWITLKLEGVQSNRAAIGARIQVTVNTPTGDRDVYATVTTGGSFGANSLQQEMGLGDATGIRAIRITWPVSGMTDVYTEVGLDRMLRIREGAAAPEPVQLRQFDLAKPGNPR
jgi:hypothetical protein